MSEYVPHVEIESTVVPSIQHNLQLVPATSMFTVPALIEQVGDVHSFSSSLWLHNVKHFRHLPEMFFMSLNDNRTLRFLIPPFYSEVQQDLFRF